MVPLRGLSPSGTNVKIVSTNLSFAQNNYPQQKAPKILLIYDTSNRFYTINLRVNLSNKFINHKINN